MTGVLRTARISTVGVIVRVVNELGLVNCSCYKSFIHCLNYIILQSFLARLRERIE